MQVFNKRDKSVPQSAIYIGRPSIWGNPFSHKKDTQASIVCDSREIAVTAYALYLLGNESLLEDLSSLRGKDLVCWCSPQKCHGDKLLQFANQPQAITIALQWVDAHFSIHPKSLSLEGCVSVAHQIESMKTTQSLERK